MRNFLLVLLLLLSVYSAAFAQEPAKATASSVIDPEGEPGRVRFRKRFSDTEHYSAIAAYLKAEEEVGGVGPSGHGREVDIYLPKAVAEIIASQKPGELLSYLIAYFDHPEIYKLYRLRDLIMLSLSRELPSTFISSHWDKVPDEEMRCFGVPRYLATILYRDLPKSDKKDDWITYCNDLHIWGIVPL